MQNSNCTTTKRIVTDPFQIFDSSGWRKKAKTKNLHLSSLFSPSNLNISVHRTPSRRNHSFDTHRLSALVHPCTLSQRLSRSQIELVEEDNDPYDDTLDLIGEQLAPDPPEELPPCPITYNFAPPKKWRQTAKKVSGEIGNFFTRVKLFFKLKPKSGSQIRGVLFGMFYSIQTEKITADIQNQFNKDFEEIFDQNQEHCSQFKKDVARHTFVYRHDPYMHISDEKPILEYSQDKIEERSNTLKELLSPNDNPSWLHAIKSACSQTTTSSISFEQTLAFNDESTRHFTYSTKVSLNGKSLDTEFTYLAVEVQDLCRRPAILIQPERNADGLITQIKVISQGSIDLVKVIDGEKAYFPEGRNAVKSFLTYNITLDEQSKPQIHDFKIAHKVSKKLKKCK